MGIGSRMKSLDDRTGAAAFGRFSSRIGGYWCLFVGLAALVVGVVDLAIGDGTDAVAAFLIGGVAVAIGVFIGPRRLVRRLIGRG